MPLAASGGSGIGRKGRRAPSLLPGLAVPIVLCGAFLGGAATGGIGATPDRQGPPGAPFQEFHSLSRSRFLMGAPLTIEAVGQDAEHAIAAAFNEVARLDEVLSNWHESELTRLNDQAAHGSVRCSEDLFGAVVEALRWAEATDGSYDPTVEPLVRRLGLRGREGRLPGSDTEIHRSDPPKGDASREAAVEAPERRLPVGWRLVRTDAASRMVVFDSPGVGIDLGGIGKGMALDAAMRVLRAHGVAAALLDFGGQLLAYGQGPDDGAWLVGLADPRDRGRTAGVLPLRDASLSTSGTGERSRMTAAGPIGHVLDPRSQAPARFPGTVSVLAPDATSADALSTALFVMGPDRGLRWARSRGYDVLYEFLDADGHLVRRGTGQLHKTIAWVSSGTSTPIRW